MSTDQQLIARIAAGEHSALADLYDRFGCQLHTLALRILGNGRDAEDLLHDVFLEVWKCAANYDSKRGSVQAWLFTRIRSRAIDRLRCLKRFHELVNIRSDAPAEALREVTPDVQSDHHKAKAALSALPESHRVAIELIYFEGLSYHEAAERCGIPVGTVKSRTAAAIRKLRDHFSIEHEAADL